MLEPGSRLQERCLARMETEFSEMQAFRDSGGEILGYLCQGFPPAAAAGLGMWPVRVLSEAGIELEDKGALLVRPDICPLVKVFLGGVSTGSGIYGLVDVWAGLATCDQTRRCFSELPGLTGARVHHLQLPATRSEASEAYYRGLVERFCADAAEDGYDQAKALKYANDRFLAGSVLVDAALSGSVSPLDLHWLFHFFHIARPDGLDGILTSLLEDAEPFSPEVRVVMAGSSVALEDVAILSVLQSRNVGVIPLHCTGMQSLPAFDLNGMPRSGSPGDLADMAFRSIRCARSRPNEEMFCYIENGIAQTSSSGLIVKTMKFCDLWFTERERFRERITVPVLVIDTAFSPGETERQSARVEAFLETVVQP
jgi:benzoyl-CoA reductase/2-hydroxyglutaryl-CoA dehydratase subunit BcrC/BadD/HgdB